MTTTKEDLGRESLRKKATTDKNLTILEASLETTQTLRDWNGKVNPDSTVSIIKDIWIKASEKIEDVQEDLDEALFIIDSEEEKTYERPES